MAKRRAAHEGSIRKRKDGLWEARVMLGGRRYSVYGRTRAEAVRKMQELVGHYRAGTFSPPSSLTFEDWAGEWLEGCRGRLRPKTVESYQDAMTALLPYLGRLRLHKLAPLHVHHALQQLARGGKGERALMLAYGALRACLNQARHLGLIAANPCEAVPRPRYEPAERPRWGALEARRFLQAVQERGDTLAVMAGLALLTGCRLGELLGLTWGDVDWGAGLLHVRRSLTWVRGRPLLQKPKTRAGERVVALPSLALALLGKLPREAVYLFWAERPPATKQVARTMTELCQRAGVPRLNFHSLRSVAASLLVARGMELRAIQALLGHSRPSITLDTYSRHVLPQARLVAEALDEALAGGGYD